MSGSISTRAVTRFAIDAVVKLSCTNCTFVGYRDTIISTFGTSGVHYSTLNNNIFYNSGSIVGNLGNAIGSNNDFYNTPQNSNFSLTGTITTKPLFTDTIYYQNINLSGIGSNLHLNLLGTSNPVTPVIIITPNCAQSLKSACSPSR